MEDRPAPNPPTFAEALRFWLKLGFISFGGPTGQIAIMHAELVEKRRWISEERFLHALNYCMLLPGPEAQQLATYIGWLLHRTPGGIIAGALFVLPSVFILWLLSYVYTAHGNLPAVEAIFAGLKPAVLAIVIHAVHRIGRRALKNSVMWGVAAAAFIAIFFFKVYFPVIILAAGLLGYIGGRRFPALFAVAKPHGVVGKQSSPVPHTPAPTLGRALRVLATCLILWWTPVLLAGALIGTDSTQFKQGLFFSKAAMVTFGGAYAVLPYIAQAAVEQHGWLSAGQMLDGLGLAETTPGPLIMVVQFVGFVGGWQHPGAMSPLLSATLSALLTTWVTFLPSFLYIFLGAPHVERLRGNTLLTSALSTITAAVVGVILNLSVWFGLQVIFPAGGGVDLFSVFICAAALLTLYRTKAGVITVVAVSGLCGLVYRQVLAT